MYTRNGVEYMTAAEVVEFATAEGDKYIEEAFNGKRRYRATRWQQAALAYRFAARVAQKYFEQQKRQEMIDAHVQHQAKQS